MPARRRVELYSSPFQEPREAWLLEEPRTVEELLRAVDWRRPRASTRVLVGGSEFEGEALEPGLELALVHLPAEPVSLSAIIAFFVAVGEAAASAATVGLIGGTATIGVGLSVGVAGTAVAIGTFIGSSVLSYGVSALVGSLIKPPEQQLAKSDGGEVSPTLQDGGNSVRPNAPFPYVAGDFRMVPPIVYPHTFIRGGESVFQALFIVGLGEHQFTSADIMIGDLPISAFDRAVVTIRQGLSTDPGITLFTRRIFQISVNSVFDSIRFDDPTLRSPWVQFQVPGEGHGKLAVALNFTQGIGRISNSSHPQQYAIGFQVEYRSNGGAWLSVNDASGLQNVDTVLTKKFPGNPQLVVFQGLKVLRFQGDSTRPYQVGFSWNVTGDSDDIWDVRMRRVEVLPAGVLLGSGGSSAIFGTVIWFALQGFNYGAPPIQSSGVATIELELPLDAQFSGLQNNLSVQARRIVRIYNPAASGGADSDGWSNLKFVSNNPAAIIRDMLQGANNRTPAANADLDIAAFTSFYVFCRDLVDGAVGILRFDHIFDARTDLLSACQSVAAAGRGRFFQNGNGQYTVVYDGPKTGPERYAIYASNCRSFRIKNVFPLAVNAIRAQFVDRDSGFDANAELVVYRDGFSELTVEEAEIETRSYVGATTAAVAYARARYDLADQQLRPRQIEAEMYVEQLGIPIGSLVKFSHPGAFIGEAWGRIKRATAKIYRDSFDSDFHPYSGSARTLTNLTAVWGDVSGSVMHGVGAGKLTTTSASLASVLQPLAAAHSWTGCSVGVYVQAGQASSLSSSDGFRIKLYGPTLSDFRSWSFGTSAGLGTTAMTLVSKLLTDTATSTGGTFNGASVIAWELQMNVVGASAGRGWRIDSFQVTRTDGKIAEVELDQSVGVSGTMVYAVEHRVPDSATFQNELKRRDVRTLSSYGVLTDQVVSAVYLATPVSVGSQEPAEDQLYAFGPSATVSHRMIVREKQAGSDLSARVVLIDEAPAIQTSTGALPAFDPGTGLLAPITRVGPDLPAIRQIITDERALARAADGTLRARILVDVAPGTAAGRPRADFWALRYRRTAPSVFEGVALPRIDASASQLVIDDVDEGATYDISLQAVTRGGLVSAPAQQTTTVLGKTGAPPNVTNLRVEGTNLQWTLADPPADLAGFRVRRGAVGGIFTQAVSLHGDTLLAGSPFSIAPFDPGLSTLYVVAEDVAGNQSVVPAAVSAFVGAVPVQNVVTTVSVSGAGFPIVNQIDPILNGFEDLLGKETPDTALNVIYPAETAAVIASPLQGDAQTQLDVERTTVFAGVRALRLTDLDGSGAKVTLTYVSPINRDKSTLRFQFRGLRSGVTWTVRYRLIDATDANKWSRWDQAAVATLTWVQVSKDLTTSATAVGSSGGVDLKKVKFLEVSVDSSSLASNDASLLDSGEWVGGALNGVEVISGALKNQANAGEFWSATPSAPFWSATPTQPFWASVVYLDGIYEWTTVVTSGNLPADLRISISDPGVPYQLQYKPLGGLAFVPFPGVLESVSAATYSFRLLLAGGLVRGSVSSLSVILDVEDERETVKEFSVSSTGTVRIPITKTYREIRTVIGQPQGSGVAFLEILDKNVTLGPSVAAKDSGGTRITKTVDWFIEGVKG